jgi:hypothetical protein
LVKPTDVVILVDGTERSEISGLAAEILRCIAEYQHAINRLPAEEGNIQVFFNKSDITLSMMNLYRGFKRKG